MNHEQVHKAQVSILHSLRYAPAERFSVLMKPTGQTSDTFKFHVRKLIKLGYVEKLDRGEYVLTAAGKEYANNLDEPRRLPLRQPKLSVLIVTPRRTDDGKTLYLLQKRMRNPFYGYWGEITGPVRWGESFDEAAKKVLLKQTGLCAGFQVRSMRRIRDYEAKTGRLLEDKLFVIVEALNLVGELKNDYAGGMNAWLSLENLLEQDKYFESTLKIIKSFDNGDIYTAQDITYESEEY